MEPTNDVMKLCRLCLASQTNFATFDDREREGAVKIYFKINSCLPVKVSEDDLLPKKICDDCIFKVELVYSFWTTTLNSEKQLLDWLGPSDSVETIVHVPKTELVDDLKEELVQDINMGENASTLVDEAIESFKTQEELESDEESEDDVDADDGEYSEEEEDAVANELSLENLPTNQTDPLTEPGPSGIKQELSENSGCDDYETAENRLSSSAEKEKSTLKCSFCRQTGFKNKEYLACHMMQHALKLHPLQCDVCRKMCDSTIALRQHRKSHNDMYLFPCDECEEKFKTASDLKKHTVVHSPKKQYKCDKCDYLTHREFYLKHHQKVHNKKFKFNCKLCGEGFNSRHEYSTHITDAHEAEKKFFCEMCGRSYLTRLSLLSHQKTHEPGYKPGYVEKQCEVCGKVLASRSTLKIHMLVHTGARPYKCHICGKCVRSNEFLKIHIRTHTGEKPFKCEVCPKAFTSVEYLKEHMRTHTGEKPFACNECGKCFSQRNTLAVHKRYHTGQRPFQCRVCSQAFITRTLMRIHLKKKHDTEDSSEEEADNTNADSENANTSSDNASTSKADDPPLQLRIASAAKSLFANKKLN